MIGEVHYWRDLSRVLDGIQAEVKQPQVEMTIQILLKQAEIENGGIDFEINKNFIHDDVNSFTKQKSRIMKGAKEARWNNKYMKIIERPVKQIELATDLNDI